MTMVVASSLGFFAMFCLLFIQTDSQKHPKTSLTKIKQIGQPEDVEG